MTADETSASAAEELPPSAENTKTKKKKTPPQDPAPLDVSKLDIRVGVINKCWEHEEADKLYCEEIDLGEESGPRSIASGLKAHYSVEEMVGKKVLVLANLKSRKLVGFPSHGMVLCASKYGEAEDGSDDSVEFVCPPKDAAIGERIVCAGFEGEPATENQVNKKNSTSRSVRRHCRRRMLGSGVSVVELPKRASMRSLSASTVRRHRK